MRRDPDSCAAEEAVAVTSTTRTDVARSAGAFAISVREQCHLSQRTVNSVISGVQQYQAVLLDTLRERMRRVFEEHPETPTQLQDAALATFDTFVDPFCTTAYGQNRAIQELFNPVDPEEVVVSQKICWLNFKNVCKSLANHNQFLESCQNEIGIEHPIFANERESGPVSAVTNTEYVKRKVKDFLGIEVMKSVVSVKWYILNGNKYISGKSMIIADVDDTLPVFGLIKDIFLIDSSFVAFEYQRYETLNLNQDLLAYEVAVPTLAQAMELVHKLIDHTSYFSVSFRESVFVPIKYSLSDVIAQRNQHED
ncbi:hypothetical protein ABVT39_001233 [Epinephelus coioides]